MRTSLGSGCPLGETEKCLLTWKLCCYLPPGLQESPINTHLHTNLQGSGWVSSLSSSTFLSQSHTTFKEIGSWELSRNRYLDQHTSTSAPGHVKPLHWWVWVPNFPSHYFKVPHSPPSLPPPPPCGALSLVFFLVFAHTTNVSSFSDYRKKQHLLLSYWSFLLLWETSPSCSLLPSPLLFGLTNVHLCSPENTGNEDEGGSVRKGNSRNGFCYFLVNTILFFVIQTCIFIVEKC